MYSQSGGAAFQRFYAQRGTPAHVADANSQGFIFQRTGSDACTPSDASYNTGIISVSLYVYIKDLVTKQYLFCRSYQDGTDFDRGFCAGIENGQFFAEINTAGVFPYGGDYVETQMIGATYAKGWNMVGIYSGPAGTSINNVMFNGTGSAAGPVTHTAGQFIDDDALVNCIGGRRTSTTAARDSLRGMINGVTIYSDQVLAADLYAAISLA